MFVHDTFDKEFPNIHNVKGGVTPTTNAIHRRGRITRTAFSVPNCKTELERPKTSTKCLTLTRSGNEKCLINNNLSRRN